MATNSRSAALWTLRSVPLGKYCLSSPLVFLLVPRCHGEPGSQKNTGHFVVRLPSFSGHPICTDLVSVREDVHCESTAQEVHAGVPA